MATNFDQPLISQTLAAFSASIRSNQTGIASWMEDEAAPTGIATGAKRYNSTSKKLERWNGSAWADLTCFGALATPITSIFSGNLTAVYDASNYCQIVANAGGDGILVPGTDTFYVGNTLSSVDAKFIVTGSGFTNKILLNSNGDSYFNGGNSAFGHTSPSALIHGIKTTEQLRLGYDASNYATFTVNPSGYLSLGGSDLRVGIGTASPAVAADVVGQVRASTGILFGTDTAAANALDDYEEGTWTPADASGAGLSFSSVEATYTKIGNTVRASFNLTYQATADGTNVKIGGLPFTCAANSTNGGAPVFTNSGLDLGFQVGGGETAFYVWKSSGASVINSELGGTVLRGVLIYTV